MRQRGRWPSCPTTIPSLANRSEPAIELAEQLVKMSPNGLDHVFFTNSGSEANDSVIKLVWFYNNAIGRPEKKKFIARTGGYHGITVASGSLTGLPANHRGFDLPLAFVKHVTSPHHYRFAEAGESEEAFADRLAAELEAMILAEGPDTVAAFIGEPLIGRRRRAAASGYLLGEGPGGLPQIRHASRCRRSHQWLRPSRDDCSPANNMAFSRISWWCRSRSLRPICRSPPC